MKYQHLYVLCSYRASEVFQYVQTYLGYQWYVERYYENGMITLQDIILWVHGKIWNDSQASSFEGYDLFWIGGIRISLKLTDPEDSVGFIVLSQSKSKK